MRRLAVRNIGILTFSGTEVIPVEAAVLHDLAVIKDNLASRLHCRKVHLDPAGHILTEIQYLLTFNGTNYLNRCKLFVHQNRQAVAVMQLAQVIFNHLSLYPAFAARQCPIRVVQPRVKILAVIDRAFHNSRRFAQPVTVGRNYLFASIGILQMNLGDHPHPVTIDIGKSSVKSKASLVPCS